MRKTTKQLLVHEIADWHHRGLIDADTRKRLSTPYEQPGQLLSSVLQWLGIGAVLLIGMAVLGGVSLFSESVMVGAMLFFCAGVGLWWVARAHGPRSGSTNAGHRSGDPDHRPDPYRRKPAAGLFGQ